jgi:hypothetical protein
MVTTEQARAAEPAAKRGFGSLPCPKCGAEATVSLDLDDMEGDEACRCNECDTTFGLADVRRFISAWQRVLAWVELAPALEG